MGFKALNESVQQETVSKETHEAREARIIQMYERAMRAVVESNDVHGIALLTSILAEAPIQQAGDTTNKDPTQRMRQIRYLVVKNLAGLYSKSNETALKALPYYKEALSLDPNDALLWRRLGNLACENGRWDLARHALEKSLLISPKDVMVAEKLLEVLLHLHDLRAVCFVAEHLQKINAGHHRATQLLKIIQYSRSQVDSKHYKQLESLLRPRLPSLGKPSGTDTLSTDASHHGGTIVIDLKDASWEVFLQGLLHTWAVSSSEPNSQVHLRPVALQVKGERPDKILEQRQADTVAKKAPLSANNADAPEPEGGEAPLFIPVSSTQDMDSKQDSGGPDKTHLANMAHGGQEPSDRQAATVSLVQKITTVDLDLPSTEELPMTEESQALVDRPMEELGGNDRTEIIGNSSTNEVQLQKQPSQSGLNQDPKQNQIGVPADSTDKNLAEANKGKVFGQDDSEQPKNVQAQTDIQEGEGKNPSAKPVRKTRGVNKSKEPKIDAAGGKQQSKQRNIVTTLSPFIGPREPPLTITGKGKGSSTPEQIGIAVHSEPLPDLLAFMEEHSGCLTLPDLCQAVVQALSCCNVATMEISQSLAKLDLAVQGTTKAACAAITLAEIHIDYAAILGTKSRLKGKSAWKATPGVKGGDAPKENAPVFSEGYARQNEHLQAAQDNLGAFYMAMPDQLAETITADPALRLRCLWARGRLAEIRGDAKQAAECFSSCEKLCQAKADDRAVTEDSSVQDLAFLLPHCLKDNVISAEAAALKLGTAEVLKVIEQGPQQLAAGHHASLIRKLLPLCIGPKSSLDKLSQQKTLRLLQDAIVAMRDARNGALEIYVRMRVLCSKLRRPSESVEDVRTHAAAIRAKNPPKDVFNSKELGDGGKIIWTARLQETEDLLSLAEVIETLDLSKDTEIPELGALAKVDLQSPDSQRVVHDLQWRLVCYAERCYWAASSRKLPADDQDRSYREGLLAAITAITSLQTIDSTSEGDQLECLGPFTEMLAERHAHSLRQHLYQKLCLQRLCLHLQALETGFDTDGPNSEEEEQVESLHAIIAQCLFLTFGLAMPNKDALWGGGLKESEGQMESEEQALQAWPHVRRYAHYILQDAPKLAELADVFSQIQRLTPPTHKDLASYEFAGQIILADKSISADALLDQPRPQYAEKLLRLPEHISKLVVSDAYRDLHTDLLEFEMIVDSYNLELKGLMLKEEGMSRLNRVVELANKHLCYHPLSYTTWDGLARSYWLAYSALLDDLSILETPPTDEHRSLVSELHRRTLLASLIARQVVPQGEENESSYAEEALGTFLLNECKDLRPMCNQVSSKPLKNESYFWNCKRAAQAFQRATEILPEEWSFHQSWGLALQLGDATAQESLPKLARANHLSKTAMGGRIDPLLCLHAARLNNLRTAKPDIALLTKFCFLEATSKKLQSAATSKPVHPNSLRAAPLNNQILAGEEKDHSHDDKLGKRPAAILSPNTDDKRPTKRLKLDSETEKCLYEDCIAAFKYCISWSKIFHKARFELARAYDDFEGNLDAAIQELRPLFTKPRRLFGIYVDIIQDSEDVGHGSKKQEQGKNAEKDLADDFTWGYGWAKVAGTGLNEEDREHQACVRRYLFYYLQLLGRASDVEHLQAASLYMNAPSFPSQHPGFRDLARMAQGVLLCTILRCLQRPTSVDVLERLSRSGNLDGSPTTTKEFDVVMNSLQAAWSLFAEYCLKLENSKAQSWQSMVESAVKALSDLGQHNENSQIVSTLSEYNCTLLSVRYLQALGAKDDAETLLSIITKLAKRKGWLPEAGRQLFGALRQAGSRCMVSCLRAVEEHCSESQGLRSLARKSEEKEKMAGTGSAETEPAPEKQSDTNLTRADGGEGEDVGAAITKLRAQGLITDTYTQDGRVTKEAESLKMATEKCLWAAFQRLKTMHLLHKGIISLDETGPGMKVAVHPDCEDANAVVVTAVSAYCQATLGQQVQTAHLDIQEAERMLDDLVKQVGRPSTTSAPTAAPVPAFVPRAAHDQPQLNASAQL